ncbi:MAG: septation protein SepH [Lawsonella clevelandensis]
MRELHVAGYNADENSIILRDPTTEEEFSVIADEQLRAAARGDVPGLRRVRVGEIQHHASLEIQELIRAGASTDELADRAGMQRSRLDNLARPILMERANMVHRAQESHPILADGPSDITLAMAVHTGLECTRYRLPRRKLGLVEDSRWPLDH